MPQVTWSQDKFTKGELAPLMYARVTLQAYYDGLKRAKNVITFPQGGAGKRFGTLYLNEISGVTDWREIYFEDFQYLTECTYLIVIKPSTITIYLEGMEVASVTPTNIPTAEIPNLDTTVLENRFRITNSAIQPKDLVRSAGTPVTISGFTSSTFTIGAIAGVTIIPIRFTTTGTIPTTSPQIRINKTYFARFLTTTSIEVYSTAEDAKAQINAYVISSAGTGTNQVVPLNNWALNNVTFRNRPVYDFTQNYDAITFTPAATTGYNIALNSSAAIFSTAYIGGGFAGNGGIARIVSFISSTQVGINILEPFDSTAGIPGSVSLLAEPAWSDTRGWPQKCSSFQSRAAFANTELLPNGIWLSAINDFNDFNDLQNDDDDAISWYPTSDNVNAIRFIVPYRSLTIHTNTGIYSTPLSFETALTPNNFSMSLQDSTPATAIQPRGIDNQIVILSGNDVHSMLWDGFNNSYASNIASIASEHLIRNPTDESEYTDLNRAGSRYMFIINEDGSLVIFQTLIAEEVQGFTPQYLEQYYGNAYFRWATGSSDGRAWFVTEREIAEAATPIALSGFGSDTLTATASNFSTTQATLAEFTTTGDLPTSSPQIVTGQYYWVIGVDANDFKVYTTKEDAENDENEITFTALGNNSNVVGWPLSTKFFLEQLSFDVFVDCAHVYDGSAVTSVGGLPRFNGQNVAINGDGFGFEDFVYNSTVEFKAHGEDREISVAQIGFPINLEIIPMPVSPPGPLGNKSSNMVFPQHIRTATIMFADSIGGQVNGFPIQYKNVENTIPGNPPIPTTGIFEFSVMNGWNEFERSSITITHSEPFEFKLIGIFYKIEES